MSDIVIQVDNLSKLYHIGAKQNRSDTLRDWLSGLVRRTQHDARDEALWALKDVSFEVKQGEVVGVIGRNGAGKSTLLKILSRITEPTKGRVVMNGRVGSLLEVGTGFHPELTGRENIFLSGAILGMRRTEIDRRFDEIVDFSGVEKFIDTPFKRFSSGMQVRLGFAVAAHLDPEILIVDEVLAVGDAAFQKKCLGKMGEVARTGRTVIFVSHNMTAIRSLCNGGILLSNGQIFFAGSASDSVSSYIGQIHQLQDRDLSSRDLGEGSNEIRLIGVNISDGASEGSGVLATGGPAKLSFLINQVKQNISCKFTIYDNGGRHVAFFDSAFSSPIDEVSTKRSELFECYIDDLPLVPGRYRINAQIDVNGEKMDHVEGAAFFTVETGYMRERRVIFSNSVNVTIAHKWVLPSRPG